MTKKRKNPVAKFARRFNKAVTMEDRLKRKKKGYRKHKGKEYEESGDCRDWNN